MSDRPEVETVEYTCPSCSVKSTSIFYQVNQVPAHSVVLLSSQDEALNYPTGDITLGFCQHCGFVYNTTFDPGLHDYSSKYEATQSYSPTFNAFHRRLAESLVDRFDLRGKRIIEIGCGQGEFLALLCNMGKNQGVGFDPAYDPKRSGHLPSDIIIIGDYYSEQYAGYDSDFICCKMTLEHIPDTFDFVSTVRRSIGDKLETRIFFQVPNASYVFNNVAFWDVYYEHCSYFSPGSLARLFRRCAFDILDLWTDYDDQYVMIEARPVNGNVSRPHSLENDLAQMEQEINGFAKQCSLNQHGWRNLIRLIRENGRTIVLWGGGSKGVSFLTTLGLKLDDVKYAVDINPNKSGTYMAGTGQEIVPPEFLRSYRPDVVVIMNPVYHAEIKQSLSDLGLSSETLTVEYI